MNALVIAVALLCSVALASVLMSFIALFQAARSACAVDRRTQARQAEMQAAVKQSQGSVEQLASELHDLEQQLPLVAAPASPRPGLNLGKRSQALRMHRRGETPEHIAAVLGIPLQEVELLLKVHRIVISNI